MFGMKTKEEMLVHETRQGNRESLGKLIRMHQDRLHNAVLRNARCPKEAEDIVQEAFVQAILKIDMLRDDRAFYPWLYRIAHNIWLGRLRSARPTISLESRREATGFDLVGPYVSPSQQMEDEESRQQVRTALNRVSEEYRSILLMREVERFDYATIASTLGIKIGTVRSRLHRARSSLRKEFEAVLAESHRRSTGRTGRTNPAHSPRLDRSRC